MAKTPYYGPETRFYGEDVAALGLPEAPGVGCGVTLVDFLLARLAEEEVWARLAPAGIVDRLRDQGERVAQRYGDPEPPEEGEGVSLADAMWWTTRDAADWIARHDPARVLAEVEAKRQIVEACQDWQRFLRERTTPLEQGGAVGEFTQMILESLAVPFSSHPDYDERWRP